MTVSISAVNRTQFSTCDSLTAGGTWTGNTAAAETELYIEGAGSVSFINKTSGINTMTFTPTASVDLSGTKHLRIWMLCTRALILATMASGGIQLGCTDGTNTGYWYVGGSDTYQGGWGHFVVDTSRAVDTGTKPTNMNAITIIYVRINMTTTSKQQANTWLDSLTVQDGIIVYGDDGGSSFGFDDILTLDNASSRCYGIIRKMNGVFYLTGSIQFGDSSGTNSCDFMDVSQVVVFEDRKVSTSLYNFTVVDNGTGTTEFQLGSKSGSSGISGCVIRVQSTAQSAKFDIVATDTDISDFKVYGCTFLDADTISFPVNATNIEVLNCNFESCGDITTSTCVVKYCNFISANSNGLQITSTSHNTSDCNIISCTYGAKFATAGTYSFSNMVFSGCTTDINNTSGGTVTINASGTTNCSTYTGTTLIVNSKTISITVKDTGGSNIENARVFVEAASGGSLPSYESVTSITRSSSTATVSHTAHGLSTGNYVKIRGAEQTEYNIVAQITKINDNSYSYTVSGTPTTPATGTITSTAVLVNELTNSSGIATETMNYTADQPIQGWARKSSATPFYKQATVTGTVTTNGFTAIMQLVEDE